ncbi:MAG: helix-turn-helix domain-containing protein [Clostridia bacterium]|nr:helix-turn-helix domain-containing protein [Clostridia bacterium]
MLNENIKTLRKSFNLSQVELADKIGVSKQCVSNWENDNVLPSIDMLIKLSKFFNVTTDSLLGLKHQTTVDVTGLSEKEIAHIKLIISDLSDNR